MKFLGFIVGNGIMKIPDVQIENAVNFKEPTNRSKLRSFLGFIGYLRNFIYNFSLIIDPLYKLLRKDMPFELKDEQKLAIEKIKSEIRTIDLLHLPDMSQPFIIYTDASGTGLGAALAQERDGETVLIQWASGDYFHENGIIP